MDPLTGMLISTALSTAGGLFAQNSAKKTQKLQIKMAQHADTFNRAQIEAANLTNDRLGKQLGDWLAAQSETNETTTSNKSWVDVEGMMKAAEQAGFNPATWLAAGGLQAYTQGLSSVTETRTGHNAAAAAQLKAQLMSPIVYQFQAPAVSHVPSVGEAIVGGLQAGFNHYNDATIRQNAQEFQKSLLQMTLDARQKSATANRGLTFGSVPTMKMAGSTTTSKGAGGLAGLGAPTPPEVGDVKVTNPWTSWHIDPTIRDSSARTDRYGESEIAESLNFLDLAIGDTMYNLTGMTRDARYDRTKQWLNNVGSFFGGLSAVTPKGDLVLPPGP